MIGTKREQGILTEIAGLNGNHDMCFHWLSEKWQDRGWSPQALEHAVSKMSRSPAVGQKCSN